uniref:Uncharacterized protein n=1 Tax=Lepeophtheirus salmonis TaxID=72036 RepID=A0A0K2T8L8_LEPSM
MPSGTFPVSLFLEFVEYDFIVSILHNKIHLKTQRYVRLGRLHRALSCSSLNPHNFSSIQTSFFNIHKMCFFLISYYFSTPPTPLFPTSSKRDMCEIYIYI